ncbi:MAG: Asp-tRNA(Asn)/Glu-tRNA(Gln) amidotransferase subunit GatB [Candidatus Omnitrophica bacterium]|nr:Asp-tRNA(Asn)/Glu-tRNA(Gln) amidotransferase subunit GatB [Candidatus Omnitrophota bacterium]
MKYETVIGLEVHVQLKTNTKAFCGCSTEFGKEPNTQVCPVCLGFPGSLPVLNSLALEYAIRVGLALNCQVQEFTKFDRKHYYYPDLPKNYQISQYDLPISKDGFLDIELEGKAKRIRIKRVHLEEDAGKLIHEKNTSLVDYNRAGMPLLEIVSEPDISSPQEAYEYLTALKSIVQYLGVSDCDMEKGSLRCDANISLREKGTTALGVKAELKNLNSFKAVKDALAFEAGRQEAVLNEGDKVIQETLLWNEQKSETFSMRSKEEAKDYRYFPEPDLPPFLISAQKIEEARSEIPELPAQKKERFVKEYGLSLYDANILVADKKNADYAEERLKAWGTEDKKPVANWLIGPLAAIAGNNNIQISQVRIPVEDFLELIDLVENKQAISNLSGKTVLAEMFSTHKKPAIIIQEKNLAQISDASSLGGIIEAVINENERSAKDYRSGKENALMFLVGQVMKKSRGKANPKVVQELLKEKLSK